MADLTHLDQHGNARMLDVGDKPATHRVAAAAGHITMQPATLELIQAGAHKKGDVIAVARVAGIMAAKRTPELIPLCHPVQLSKVEVDLHVDSERSHILCTATAETRGPTGVEIEALTAVQVALLTVYDMCKAVDRGMVMSDIRLVRKTGGRSGTWERER